ncbi:mannitol dehydrogenase family protein [Nonomuraea basaltis]|uniref:mannitol dehydrogenase family protein n=1 Tax=Nonomuraea basaltis TaxID=2495887 RepID=UPI00110C4166|nr:mannitol dehydrogenase family protein [Nonomuraea basaltis]TMR98644.1 mannitol dehydrogenase family protein [Nonomuraea basaltis]
MRLSVAALPAIPAAARPRIGRGDLRTGIVHLGLGAFHRAHQALYTEDAGDPAFGVCGVTMRSMAAAELLSAQDLLYSVLERDGARGEHASIRVCGMLTDAVGPENGIARIADPGVRVVTMTVTESGYRHDPATGRLSAKDPDVAADLAGRPPLTPVGRLVAGLRARRAAGAGPVTVICCDNLAGGGRLLGGLVTEFCELARDEALLSWIRDGNVAFPSAMVDRIVPAPTDADRADAARLLGVEDRAALATEPFRQWVIEDAFAARRPPWERAGAVITPDVEPYETMKLRLLNGVHSVLAYLGALAGLGTIAGAMARPELAEAGRRYLGLDAGPTLVPPPGVDLDGYRERLLSRLSNPALRHPIAQVAADGTHKLPQRLLPVIRDRLARGAEPRWAALGVAAWMRYVSAARADDGTPLTVMDPLAGRLRMPDAPPGEVVDRLLGLAEVFGEDLPSDRTLRALLLDWLTRLTADGALATAREP